MKLYAISDLHLGHAENRQALIDLPPQPDDWLIAAGDLGDTTAEIMLGLDLLAERFAKVIWTPGNHDLWTVPGDNDAEAGVARYEQLVDLCRQRGVLTPEDPWPIWEGEGPRAVLASTFTLYDYSFRPDEVPEGDEIAWAMESQIMCADEGYLHCAPYADKRAWCAARVELTERRLDALDPALPTVLINHYPLLRDHARLQAVPRFRIWCGTRRTEDWHKRYRALAVVYGHLHIRKSRVLDGTRFEEVSLGYPRHWEPARGMRHYLREFLPHSSSNEPR